MVGHWTGQLAPRSRSSTGSGTQRPRDTVVLGAQWSRHTHRAPSNRTALRQGDTHKRRQPAAAGNAGRARKNQEGSIFFMRSSNEVRLCLDHASLGRQHHLFEVKGGIAGVCHHCKGKGRDGGGWRAGERPVGRAASPCPPKGSTRGGRAPLSGRNKGRRRRGRRASRPARPSTRAQHGLNSDARRALHGCATHRQSVPPASSHAPSPAWRP